MKNLTLYYLIMAFISTGCTTQTNLHSTYNNGRYKYTIYPNKNLEDKNLVSISGSIKDLEKKELLEVSMLEIGCTKTISKDGFFDLKLEARGLSIKTTEAIYGQIKAISIGYLNIETIPFNFTSGDSLVIDFYMDEDKKLLIHCEGTIKMPDTI